MNPTALRGPGRDFSPGEAAKRLNPHLYGGKAPSDSLPATVAPSVERGGGIKRVRQSGKPLMNRLETEFYEILKRDNDHQVVLVKPWTFVLGNGVRYTPDFVRISYIADVGECRHRGGVTIDCYEIKGPWMTDDAAVKIKLAPGKYPFCDWWLVWKEKLPFESRWHRQLILP